MIANNLKVLNVLQASRARQAPNSVCLPRPHERLAKVSPGKLQRVLGCRGAVYAGNMFSCRTFPPAHGTHMVISLPAFMGSSYSGGRLLSKVG